MNIKYFQHNLIFKKPSGTSRGILTEKPSWILELTDENGKKGVGEFSVIPGLSPDFETLDLYVQKINDSIHHLESFISDVSVFSLDENYQFRDQAIRDFLEKLIDFPSLVFGFETAFLSLNSNDNCLFTNAFSLGKKQIPINGLIWMGEKSFMQEQIQQKLADGFQVIKMKIGAIDFETELALLTSIRERFSAEEITLRVDANGAFSPEEAKEKLKQLKDLEIHSIEQPIAVNQWEALHELCMLNDVPIALDEELIGVHHRADKIKLLETIQPPFIILKPSLHGGISGSFEWIQLAEERGIQWWITSALESSIGLNTIAQFTGEFQDLLPQGLGTGGIYTNNFPTDLKVENGFLKRLV